MPRTGMLVAHIPLTIIVPAFGRSETLARALESIAAQTALPARVIVVDDGSEPPVSLGSANVRDLNTSIIRHDSNRGPAAARNSGLRSADTDWVSFLDSDDRLLPGSLEARWRFVTEHHRKRASRVIFGCGWLEEDESGKRLGERLPRPASDPVDFASGCWFAPGSCVIMNRQEIVDAGVLQDERLRRLEDLDWFLALALCGFELRTQPIIGTVVERKWEQSPDSVEHFAGMIRKKWGLLTNDREILSRLSAYLDLECCAAHYFAGNWAKAGRHLARSLMAKPRTRLHLSPGWDAPTVPARKERAAGGIRGGEAC